MYSPTVKQSKDILDLIASPGCGLISLPSVSAKLLESDASLPRVHSSTSHSLSNPLQPGFRPHLSVEIALIKVTSEVHGGYNNYLPSLGCAIYCPSETCP